MKPCFLHFWGTFWGTFWVLSTNGFHENVINDDSKI